MAVIPQQPPAPGGGLARGVVVHHDRPGCRDPRPDHRLLEATRTGQWVPAPGPGWVGEIGLQVDEHGGGEVSRCVLVGSGWTAQLPTDVEQRHLLEALAQLLDRDQDRARWRGHDAILPHSGSRGRSPVSGV